jgi:nucleotide-binding universal stress UspA family protein
VIVIGSHGFSDLREAFEGSMSHDVVVHARRRVLVVPPPRAVS